MTTICAIDDCSDDWVVITTVDMSDTLRHYVKTGLKCLGIFISLRSHIYYDICGAGGG